MDLGCMVGVQPMLVELFFNARHYRGLEYANTMYAFAFSVFQIIYMRYVCDFVQNLRATADEGREFTSGAT